MYLFSTSFFGRDPICWMITISDNFHCHVCYNVVTHGPGTVTVLLMGSFAVKAASATTARTTLTMPRRELEQSRLVAHSPRPLSVFLSGSQICLDRNPHAFKPKVGPNKSVSRPLETQLNDICLSHFLG